MEQALLGVVLFNAFFMPNDFEQDTIEVSQTMFEVNPESTIGLENEFGSIEGMAIGSREYDQKYPWLRLGHATYLYGNTTPNKSGQRILKQSGGYVGFLLEANYENLIGVGVIAGGGTSHTKYNDQDLANIDRTNFYGLASPYVTVGVELSKKTSMNLTVSDYIFSEPAETISGRGKGFEPPHILDKKVGLEFVWSWE